MSTKSLLHIRRLKQVRKLLGPDVVAKLVASLVFSRLDYCNALVVLAGLTRSTKAPLQRVQNAAARLGPRDHVTPALKDCHWLPIKQRIVLKLCLLMHLHREAEKRNPFHFVRIF